jgi:L-malate glycosyltransferase
VQNSTGILYAIDELWGIGGAERNLVQTVRRLPRDLFSPVVLTFLLNKDVAEFATLNCPVVVLPLTKIYGWSAARSIPALWRLLTEHRIGIVHAFFEASDLWAGVLGKSLRGCRWISSRRDMGMRRNRMLDAAYRHAGRWIDQVHAVSDEVREYTIQHDGLEPGKVITVPNGIDLETVGATIERAEIRRRYGLSEQPVVVTTANIRHVKGIDVLVETAARLRSRIPGVQFVVAGRPLEPDYNRRILDAVREQGLGGTITFAGEVIDVYSLLAASDAFYLPSRGEGMSNALLEAMAAGLPAVATSVGGNRSLIRSGVNGFLTAVENADEAAARLEDILTSGRAREMGAAGRKRVEDDYSMKAVIELLVSQYQMLLRS